MHELGVLRYVVKTVAQANYFQLLSSITRKSRLSLYQQRREKESIKKDVHFFEVYVLIFLFTQV